MGTDDQQPRTRIHGIDAIGLDNTTDILWYINKNLYLYIFRVSCWADAKIFLIQTTSEGRPIPYTKQNAHWEWALNGSTHWVYENIYELVAESTWHWRVLAYKITSTSQYQWGKWRDEFPVSLVAEMVLCS